MQTIKLHDVARWRQADRMLTFEGRGARRIRLHLNSPGTSLAWLTSPEGEILQFLARVEGYQIVEFYASGTVNVLIDGQDTWWMCAETEPTHITVKDPEVFTRMAERRHRNPELEQMMHMMQVNIERRMAAQAHEFEELLARERAHAAAAGGNQTGVPNASGEGAKPEESAGGSEPGEATGGQDEGEQSGG